MSDFIRVSLVQAKLAWGKVDENLQRFSNLLASLKRETDLIVLPEMFTSGFMMDEKHLVAAKSSEALHWMISMAKDLNAKILGSMIVEENDQYYNRLYCVGAEGVICVYDKRHLFRMGGEQNHFSSGTEKVIFKIGNWRIRPLVCYDLRFPVWSRNTNDYDLLIYVANWPEVRQDVWNTLLKARAIENQSFVVGVNRIGVDGMGLTYSGDSSLIDAKGKLLGKCSNYKEEVLSFNLHLKDLHQFREKFPAHLDADSFQLI